jgi:hypothetical protein
MDEGKHYAETTGEDSADKKGHFLSDCVLYSTDIFGHLRGQFAGIDGVIPCHLLLEQGLVVYLLQFHALGRAGIAPRIQRYECYITDHLLSVQYTDPIITNFTKISNPFSAASSLIVNRSVICPKNMRKKGKETPASTAVIDPMAIYIFSL